MKRTFQSFVFGCRVNEAEKVLLDDKIAKMGYTYDTHSPQVIFINSCAVTAKAEREARQLIFQLRKKHPQARIVVTGCAATLWKHEGHIIESNVELVDNHQKSLIPALFEAYSGVSEKRQVSDKFLASGRLFVKIQDGCDRYCSYCIVPYLRGRPSSYSISSIVEYINSQKLPLSEVTLTAINTDAFGVETGESLIQLIEAILSKTKIPRIGFGSIHPWSLTKEFIDYYRTSLSKENRFVQFFHVPLQSCSNTVLKYMKRDYKIEDVMSKLHKIKSIRPDALIATDIITGFLGETKELFEETYNTLQASPISRFHVFRFSNRPNTASFYLKKRLFEPSNKIKKQRSQKLIELSKKKYRHFLSSLKGMLFSGFVVKQSKDGPSKILLSNNVEALSNEKNLESHKIINFVVKESLETYVKVVLRNQRDSNPQPLP